MFDASGSAHFTRKVGCIDFFAQLDYALQMQIFFSQIIKSIPSVTI